MYKLSKFSQALLIPSLIMSPLTVAVADTVEVGVEVSEGQWWSNYKIAIINSGSEPIELRGKFVEFVFPSKVTSLNWDSGG